jgi:hypothetical protein
MCSVEALGIFERYGSDRQCGTYRTRLSHLRNAVQVVILDLNGECLDWHEIHSCRTITALIYPRINRLIDGVSRSWSLQSVIQGVSVPKAHKVISPSNGRASHATLFSLLSSQMSPYDRQARIINTRADAGSFRPIHKRRSIWKNHLSRRKHICRKQQV